VTLRNTAGHYVTLTRPPISAAAAATAALTGDDARGAQMIRVEGARSTQSDIMASNGVLHIIDQVLFHSSGFSSLSLFVSLFVCMFVRLCVGKQDERNTGLTLKHIENGFFLLKREVYVKSLFKQFPYFKSTGKHS